MVRIVDQDEWAASSYAANGLLFCDVRKEADGSYYIQDCQRNLLASVVATDGVSNTIMFAEKVARCDPRGGTGWISGGNARDFADSGESVLSCFGAIGLPMGAGRGVGPDSKFKVLVGDRDCNPDNASSCHSVLNVIFADGSGRGLSPSINAKVWWGIVTPNEDEMSSGEF